MSLKDLINNDMKSFMKTKNELALNTVRFLKSEINNAEIEKKGELADDEIVNVIKSSIKKRRQAIELYEKGNRIDLAKKETEEIKILEKYLPEQLDENRIKKIIEETIEEENFDKTMLKKYFSEIMKKVISKTRNKADGALINKLVREYINGA